MTVAVSPASELLDLAQARGRTHELKDGVNRQSAAELCLEG